MPIRTTAIAAIAAAVLSTAASAQPFLEFTVNGGVFDNDADEQTEAVNARFVFDASAAPVFSNAFEQWFQPVAAESMTPAAPGGLAQPVNTPSDGFQSYNTNNVYLIIRDGRWQLQVLTPQSVPLYALEVFGAGPEINPTVTSLPDDPDTYQMDLGSPGASIRMIFGSTGVSFFWSPAGGFFPDLPVGDLEAQFAVTIREVDNPNPPETCPGDLDGNGVYNFGDVTTFLEIYAQGCP